MTGEFEFVSRFIKEPMIVVTGTNGKTTVVELAELFLKNSGVNVWSGGNYNRPLSEYMFSDGEGRRPSFRSFQLYVGAYRPNEAQLHCLYKLSSKPFGSLQ